MRTGELAIIGAATAAKATHLPPAWSLILGGLLAIVCGAFWPMAMSRLHERFYASGSQRTWATSVNDRMLPVRQYLGLGILCLAGLVLVVGGVVQAFRS